ncbi:MAG: hypothetical protein ACR2M5_10345 [Nakamurella sp.]
MTWADIDATAAYAHGCDASNWLRRAISPRTSDESLPTAERASLDFTVLSDPGSRLARQVGIAFQQADDVLDAQRRLGLDLAQVNAEGSTERPSAAAM